MKRIRFLQSEAIFLSGVLIATVAVLVAARRYFGILYPVARSAIYFVPLVVLTTTAILGDLRVRPKLGLIRRPVSSGASACRPAHEDYRNVDPRAVSELLS